MITHKEITVFIDMDDVLADFAGRHAERIAVNPKIQYPQAEYGFFANLEPIPDAIHGYRMLDELFNVHILTAPSVPNPMCYTEKRVWAEKHLGKRAAERMIISGFKDLLMGDYLIDDKTEGKGQDRFKGKLITFHPEYNNWKHICNNFLNLINNLNINQNESKPDFTD